MAAYASVSARTDETLGNPGSASYEQARSVVADATSLKEAVEAGEFLGPMSPAHQQEVRGILEALPPDVDRSFMTSLRGALDDNARIAFSWDAHPEGGFDHSTATRPDGTVDLMLRTPPPPSR